MLTLSQLRDFAPSSVSRYNPDNESRQVLREPFIHPAAPEHIVVTDGKILIRIPKPKRVPKWVGPVVGQGAPDYRSLMVEAHRPRKRTCWVDVSALALPPFERTRPCPDCEGMKARDAKNCWLCEGDRTVKKWNPANLGKHVFCLFYLSLLQKLPKCKLGLTDRLEAPQPFTFDGGDGMVQPMRWRDDEHDEKAVTLLLPEDADHGQ